ncbi:MAG: LysM peptidoglycan-binding domain-containing protein [Flavobacteriales bacterium]|nr:LysM peptidoglycan-binding domain-containing protein [Flavobacteriales bacterium]
MDDDSPKKIANLMEMGLWQIYKYNDLKKGDRFVKGQIVYLEPKKNKGEIDFHVIKRGDTLYAISQQYGVKLKKLQELNSPKAIGARGQKKIYLR